MPRYEMPGADAPDFSALTKFAQGYVKAAFFTASGDPDDELDGKGFSDLSAETVAEIVRECEDFRADNGPMIESLIEDGGPGGDYDEAAAGRDFWFTRNGHGVGYWDRGFAGDMGLVAQHLSDAAERAGQKDIYLGDDGTVYGM